MFRDLKEYQEIAKIYAEKVSKPEDLDERVRGGGVSGAMPSKKFTPTPQKGMGGGTGNPTNRRGIGARNNRKPEKKMSNIPVIDGPVNNPEYGKNMSRSKEDLNPKQTETKTKPQSKFIRDPKTKTLRRRGTVTARRAENLEKNKMRAQEMARERIAAKKEGTASTPMSGKERAQAMAKARLAKKAEMAKEDYTPYDIVLDYLLSSEQAATIEEANYIMTEMDAETIQSIVAE